MLLKGKQFAAEFIELDGYFSSSNMMQTINTKALHMQIEYVTDAVLWLKLRCIKCRGPVRQMREDLSGSQSVFIFLCGEPLGWLVVGGGALLGFFADALVFMLLAWLVITPIGLVWLYLHRLRRASFLCSGCGHVNSYAEARRSAGMP